jgi:PhoPQ-activated pathogenicity-related protein
MEKTPKYVIVSAGDEFFMPDAAQYYWNDLPGEKLLRVVPNSEHSLAGSVKNVISSAVQYSITFLNPASKRPSYTWDISADGYTIDFTTQTPSMVLGVQVWVSRPNKRRDFRLIRCTDGPACVNPALFESHKLEVSADGTYSHTIPAPPENHWVAFMIQVDFDVGNTTSPLRVTSDLSIAPRNVFPFPPCADNVCKCEWNCNHSLIIQPGPHTN